MSAARRILLIGGIALTLWGMAHGLWYAVFAEHQALEGIGASLSAAFSGAAQQDMAAVETSLVHYQAAKYGYDRHVDVHSHWVGLATILIVLAIGFDRLAFSEKFKLLLAVMLLLGAVLFPLGVLLQVFEHGALPRAVAVLGSALEIGAFLVVAIGFGREKASTSSRASG